MVCWVNCDILTTWSIVTSEINEAYLYIHLKLSALQVFLFSRKKSKWNTEKEGMEKSMGIGKGDGDGGCLGAYCVLRPTNTTPSDFSFFFLVG